VRASSTDKESPSGANGDLRHFVAPLAVTLDTIGWRRESPSESAPHREFEFPTHHRDISLGAWGGSSQATDEDTEDRSDSSRQGSET
jgi:hypothetical protein